MDNKKLALFIIHYMDMLGDAARQLTGINEAILELEKDHPELFVTVSGQVNFALLGLGALSQRMGRDVTFLSDEYFNFGKVEETNETNN